MSFVRRRIGRQPKVSPVPLYLLCSRSRQTFSRLLLPSVAVRFDTASACSPEAEPKPSGDLASGCDSEICKARKREDAVACFRGMGPTPPPRIYSSSHKTRKSRKSRKGRAASRSCRRRIYKDAGSQMYLRGRQFKSFRFLRAAAVVALVMMRLKWLWLMATVARSTS